MKTNTSDAADQAFQVTPAMKLRYAYLNMHRTFDARFRRFGVTTDQFVLMSILREQEGVNQQELARKLASDANTIAAMVALLERKKIVRRTVRDGDGRARAVFLTASGRKLLAGLKESAEGLHRMIEECFPMESRAIAFDVLDSVAEEMSVARTAGKDKDRGMATAERRV